MHKLKKENVQDIIKNYAEWNEDSSRRWYLMKKENNSHRMTRKLPKYYQIYEWNKTFNDENKQLIDIRKTKQFGSKLKEQLLGKYNSECDTTGCFSCNEVKRQYQEKMRKKEEEWESKKEEREKMKEKEDKAWRDYFGMTLSQATKYEEEKEKRINEEYEKLMQNRNRIKNNHQHQRPPLEDGNNGTD